MKVVFIDFFYVSDRLLNLYIGTIQHEFVLDADTMTLTDVFKILAAGHFPLFPYAAYPMVGLIIGRVLLSNRSPSKEPH